MKYLPLVLVFTFCTSIISVAQNDSTQYGKVSKEELALTTYAPDKSAEAVVLSNVGKSYFVRDESTFFLVFERTTRIKILSDAGLHYADIEIPFYHEGEAFEEIFDIEAASYNLENGVVSKTPLNVSSYQDETINERWNNRKIALPNVKAGSIIEYRYKIRSRNLGNMRDWEFQWRIPVVYSEYEVGLIPFYAFVYQLQGAGKLATDTSYVGSAFPDRYGPVTYKPLTHKFVMKNLPAYRDEEFVTSPKDFISKVDFQLSKVYYLDGSSREIMKTWKQLIEELIDNDNFGKYVKKSERLADDIFKDTLSKKSAVEKYNAVLSYVKKSYSWNKHYGKYATKSPSDLQKDKLGSDADINLFTVGLLKGVGIDACPVVISSRGNGKIKYNYPFSSYFNYVVISATIDGKRYIADATEVFAKNDRIPVRCINDKGLLVSSGKVEWVPLQSDAPSELKTTISMSLSGVTLNSTVEVEANEYFALHDRNKYDDTKKLSEKLSKEGYNTPDSAITVKNQSNINEPYIYRFTSSNNVEMVSNKLYIQPFLSEVISDNPLKQNGRTYPIDMTYAKKFVFSTTIAIPDGYKVDYLPENLKYIGDIVDYDYRITSSDKAISVTYVYYFKIPIFLARDYQRLKYYYNEIIKKGSEKIVLSKKV